MAPRRGNEKAPRNVPQNSCRRIRGEGGRGGRLGYHPERRGGDEMSWLLPPALPLGSLSKAAKPPPPPPQGWRWEGRGRYLVSGVVKCHFASRSFPIAFRFQL